MTDEHKDVDEGEGEGSPDTGEGERTVPLSVMETMRSDMQGKVDAEKARADEAEARTTESEKDKAGEDWGEYDEDQLAAVDKRIAEQTGGLDAEALKGLMAFAQLIQESTSLGAVVDGIKGIEGVPDELLPTSPEVIAEIDAIKTEHGIGSDDAYRRFLTKPENIEKLMSVGGKTSDAKRQELLDRKKGAGVSHSEGSLGEAAAGDEKSWVESLPPEVRADSRAVVDKAMERAEQKTGLTIPGGPA